MSDMPQWTYEGVPNTGFVYLITPQGKRAATIFGNSATKIARAKKIVKALNFLEESEKRL